MITSKEINRSDWDLGAIARTNSIKPMPLNSSPNSPVKSSFNSRYIALTPSSQLQDFVSHYWLSVHTTDTTHIALPDGAVDVVLQVDGRSAHSWVYGTTTMRTDVPLMQGCHYLGIRFKPGQSRHFIQASADELTDGHTSTQGVLRFSLDRMAEEVTNQGVAHQLNQVLAGYLHRQPPSRHRIDEVIHLIESSRGTLRIREAVDIFGKSRRQFERVFLETVGVSAKSFATIIRFQHAARLIAPPYNVSLSTVAAELEYSDQSHMTHEFKRLANVPPVQFLHDHVAFLQDLSCHSLDTGVQGNH